MEKEQLFVPPYLQSLGYGQVPEFREIANRAVTVTDDTILYDWVWSPWRGILEYVCCVEYSREMLRTLPSGRALGYEHVVPARYHSAALVFFAQATLDNLAVWTSKRLSLPVKGSDCAFHKNKFNQALAGSVPGVAQAVGAYKPFISKLESYRQEWIHRLTGGAAIYSDKSPSEPDAKIEIMVPVNPAINQHAHDPEAYVRAVARSRTNNSGKWLYPITEFGDEFADGLKALLVCFLRAALDEPGFSST